jgi:hypothetical protein
MGWAVRKDGLGWRSVDNEQDCTEFEIYTETEPSPVNVVVIKTKFTSLEFLDKFTQAEQLGVVEASMTNAAVKLWYDRLLAASFVDLEDSRIPDGLNALVAAGLLEASRVAEIMTPEEQN